MTEESRIGQGVIVRGIGSFYSVKDENGQLYTVRAKKKFRKQGLTPLVGDRVRFMPGEEDTDGWLEEILPRENVFVRPPVSNISRMMVVIAPEPAPDLLLVDRLMARACQQNMKRTLVVSKQDLDRGLIQEMERQYAGAGCEIVGVSSVTGEGLEQVRSLMEHEVSCLAGQSGVGKSTLLNALLDLGQETGAISERILRGRNTTRHVELFTRGNIQVLDTAGFSLLEMEEVMDPVLLREMIPEFDPYEGQCRFTPCLHDREPGCRVTQAAASGEISQERLDRYRILLSQVRQTWKDRYD